MSIILNKICMNPSSFFRFQPLLIDGSFFIETTNGLRVATETTAANGVKLVLATPDDTSASQKFLFNATAYGNDLCKKGSRYVS